MTLDTITTEILSSETSQRQGERVGATPYMSDSIIVMEGLDAVRRRPGMYIGDTGSRGLHHLVWEILDNSVDEAMGGYAGLIRIRIWEEGGKQWISVSDNGRGMPVDTHAKTGLPACETIMTVLHAGGKFGGGAYSFSGGLHGVGASVVNALSEKLKLVILRNGKIYEQSFSKGVVTTKLSSKKAPDGTSGSGTLVAFTPDFSIFADALSENDGKFDSRLIERRIRELSYLLPGIRFELTDARKGDETSVVFESSGGLNDFLGSIMERLEGMSDPITVEGEKDGVPVQCSFGYVKDYSERLFSYVNLIPTHDGGTHVTGFKTGLTRAVNESARYEKMLKEKDENLSGEDLKEGLVAILSVKVSEPQFEGQTKGRLGNAPVAGIVSSIVYDRLLWFFGTSDGKKTLSKIVEKALLTRQAREAAKHARDVVRKNSKSESKFDMPGKLADCSSDKPEERELFIVEGDSAGGSAKQGRDRKIQAILPLRGKILNCEKAPVSKAFENEEIRTMIRTLGCGLGDDYNPKDLRYGKVFIMTDADVDGSHIRTLLLTFFYRMMPKLLEDGRIFAAMPPLYRVKWKSNEKYLYNDRELAEVTKKIKGDYVVQRYKGLGEMSPEQLWNTTMDPEKRMSIRLRIEDAVEADETVTSLMGTSSETRKTLLFS